MNQASTIGKHRARITLATLMSRFTGLEDARGLPMPAGVTNTEQLRDMVEEIEAKRVAEAGGYTPRHRIEPTSERDLRPLLAGVRW